MKYSEAYKQIETVFTGIYNDQEKDLLNNILPFCSPSADRVVTSLLTNDFNIYNFGYVISWLEDLNYSLGRREKIEVIQIARAINKYYENKTNNIADRIIDLAQSILNDQHKDPSIKVTTLIVDHSARRIIDVFQTDYRKLYDETYYLRADQYWTHDHYFFSDEYAAKYQTVFTIADGKVTIDLNPLNINL